MKINTNDVKFSMIDLLKECLFEINSIETLNQHKT